ncbi:hypothetical protein TB1_008766 [Malus domestica]
MLQDGSNPGAIKSFVGIDSSVAVESSNLAASSIGINSTVARTVGYLSKSRWRRISESLLVEVISLAFSTRVRHSDGRTTFIVKTHICFEYLCPYTLVSIRREFTLTNTITVVESNDDDSPRRVPSSAAIARRRSQPRTQRNINKFTPRSSSVDELARPAFTE